MFGFSRGPFPSHTAANELLPAGCEASISSRQITSRIASLSTSRRVSSRRSQCSHGNSSYSSRDVQFTATNSSLGDSHQRPTSVEAHKSTSNTEEGAPADAAGDKRPPAFLDVFLEEITASNDAAAAAAGVAPASLAAATSQRAVENLKESFVSSIFSREAGGRRQTATLRSLLDGPSSPSSQAEQHIIMLRSDKGRLWQPATTGAGFSGHLQVNGQPGYPRPLSQALSESGSTSSDSSCSHAGAGHERSLFTGADSLSTRSVRAGNPIDRNSCASMSFGSTDAGQSDAGSTSGGIGDAGGTHGKRMLQLERERIAEDEKRGSGVGGGGGGGRPRGKDARKADRLYRAMAAASTSIPRTGIHAAFQLPVAPLARPVHPVTAPVSTRASPPPASKSATNINPPAAGEQDSTDSVATPATVEVANSHLHWATMPLSYHFAPIFKLCEANALVEESQIPSDLLEVAQRMRSASRDTSPPGIPSSRLAEGEEEKEVDEMISKCVSGNLLDEDGGPGRSASPRNKRSTKRTPSPRGKGLSIVAGCTAYTLPGGVEAVLVQDSRLVGAAVAWLRSSVMEDGVLGVDMEWPYKTAELAMIQIAAPSRVLLLHIAVMRGEDPSPTARDGPLYALLSDPSLTWVAAGWGHGDQQAMHRAFDGEVPPMQMMDVQAAAAAAGWPRLGLQNLVRDLLGASEFSKSRRLSTSNWAARDLGPRQVRYAALDALLPPLLLRQLRLFAAMPGLRCSFCKQAFHAPAGVQQRAPHQQQPPGPASNAGPQTVSPSPSPSASPAPSAPADNPICEVETGHATQPNSSTDSTWLRPELSAASSRLSCDHCDRVFWAAQKS